ncbi:MAG: hypothetical protein JNM30_00815 [Rhodospirillales bacterium]|nr:hypothetical protein [Rhodospirillales bacterium]
MVRIRAWSIGIAAALLLLGTAVRAQTFDSEAPRQASKLLHPNQLQSSMHKVDEMVPVATHMYVFTVQTNWGTFRAHGYDALVLLLRELYAIQRLDETSKTEAYGKALGRAAGAPIRAVENMVQDPGGTLSGIPRGIGSMFSRIGDSVTSSHRSDDGVIASATGAAAKRREIAVRYSVSPYTENKVLQDKIGELARAEALGGLTMSVATMAMPGGIGMAFSLPRTTQNLTGLLRDRTPAELREVNYDTLRNLGIPVEDARAFLANPSYNPGVQTVLAQSLGALRGVRQLESYVRLATIADDRDEAAVYQRIAQMMAGFVGQGGRIDNVGVIHGLSVALSADRDALLFLPLDELLWTQRSSQTAAAFEQIVNPLQPRQKHLYLAGYASAVMKRELAAKGWTVHEAMRGRLYDIM